MPPCTLRGWPCEGRKDQRGLPQTSTCQHWRPKRKPQRYRALEEQCEAVSIRYMVRLALLKARVHPKHIDDAMAVLAGRFRFKVHDLGGEDYRVTAQTEFG